ncbi:GDSL-like Lipase/Acylhydrolase [Gimesia panareensis]|uniref:GDSL-like Lipase/Acylhydrolase n=1 Tax=Gimesia panareensis TaxID=2527978 RepID=A0A518FGT7_9PLAN|nr:SGNH/GDSL hydrolase family protein [Gimesia panareensis]QDV15549.1 GDSL-like Lipase/Acylhydrolase [Gimesia panareensis]
MNQTSDSQPEPRPRRKQRHPVLFRLLAVLLGLALVGLLEGGLRLWGVQPLPYSRDPFVSFSEDSTLFVKNEAGTEYQTSDDRSDFFRPQHFPVQKGTNTYRVFVLGGSTVQGRPYAVETSFTNWLQLNLQAADPARKFEVVNCGGVSYASYRLVPILREALHYEPDLFIVYSGHNEFLEDRSYASLKHRPELLLQTQRSLMNLRLASVIQSLLPTAQNTTPASSESENILATDVNALLDFQKGLEKYHRDPEHHRAIMAHYEFNIRQMILLAHQAGVPLLLVNPVSNLKNCIPFKSEFDPRLTPEEIDRVNALWKSADECSWDQAERKMDFWRQATDIDDSHASLLYGVGKTCEYLKQYSAAKAWFIKAKEADVCPLRMREPMHVSLFRLSKQYDVPLIDARQLIEQKTPDGIPGSELLVDHVHPSIEGHQLIADAIYEKMCDLQLIVSPPDWKATRDQLRREQLESLEQEYFLRGAKRLRRLQGWARGRSTLVPDATTQTHTK